MSKRTGIALCTLLLIGSLLAAPAVAARDATSTQAAAFLEMIAEWWAGLFSAEPVEQPPAGEVPDGRCIIDPWGCPEGS